MIGANYTWQITIYCNGLKKATLVIGLKLSPFQCDLHMKCTRLSYDLHTTCIRLAYDLHTTCIRLAYDLHTTSKVTKTDRLLSKVDFHYYNDNNNNNDNNKHDIKRWRVIAKLSYEIDANLNPIPGKLWNYVVRQGGAIMARTDFRLSKVAKRPISTQNLLSNR